MYTTITPLGISIPQFCQLLGISRSLYYKLLQEDRVPRPMKFGRRSVIPMHAARKALEDYQGETASPVEA